jgi:curved DNA-binding protein
LPDAQPIDYYEMLQVSSSADPETIHRVYRLLAQRFHPDNKESGNARRFQELHEAYTILSNPESRARYDIVYEQRRQQRWRLVASGVDSENDFETEQLVRLTVLEALYTHRRLEPGNPGIFATDLEALIGRPREHLEFTLWYLSQRKFLLRGDSSQLVITAEGVDYLEQNYRANLQRKRLKAAEPVHAGAGVSRS